MIFLRINLTRLRIFHLVYYLLSWRGWLITPVTPPPLYPPVVVCHSVPTLHNNDCIRHSSAAYTVTLQCPRHAVIVHALLIVPFLTKLNSSYDTWPNLLSVCCIHPASISETRRLRMHDGITALRNSIYVLFIEIIQSRARWAGC